MTGVLIRSGDWDMGIHRGSTTGGHREKMTVYMLKRKKPAYTLISGL